MAPSPGCCWLQQPRERGGYELGALVLCLPLYDPLRLAEADCMLDHMSNGRLEAQLIVIDGGMISPT
jgi:hypothetical protein